VAPIRVLIVDDSALVRKLLTAVLSESKDIEVVGAAHDPLMAREKIKQLSPDVLTLDVEMPKMDGITFLSNLMRLRPMPVVMVSSLTEAGADVTLRALELGAVDFVTKPKVDLSAQLASYGDEIRAKVRAAASVRDIARLVDQRAVEAPKRTRAGFKTTGVILGIGASTGGTEAIRRVLSSLPADAPGTVIAQHIPQAFSEPFARRLDQYCALTVRQAREGEEIRVGHAYVAPGHQHLRVKRSGARFLCSLGDDDLVSGHRPSVDVLFDSLARSAGQNAIGALLTGMGQDGARGLLAMREAGARTMIQDERSSVVWGMPGAAAKLGAAEAEVSLDSIASTVMDWLKRREKGGRS